LEQRERCWPRAQKITSIVESRLALPEGDDQALQVRSGKAPQLLALFSNPKNHVSFYSLPGPEFSHEGMTSPVCDAQRRL